MTSAMMDFVWCNFYQKRHKTKQQQQQQKGEEEKKKDLKENQ